MEHAKMMYVHPAPVRVWHWIHAFGMVLLVLTGVQLRFAESITVISLEDAVKLHNYIGFLVILNYGLWVSFYFGTGKIRIYFPNPRTFVPKALEQIKFYANGIFKGDPNPHHMTPANKFNALQQKAYLGLMFVFVPAQMITGLFLWRIKQFEDYIFALGGIRIVDTVHVMLFYFFAAFMLVHFYLATLGHSPFAHFRAMFSGYEEEH